MGIFPYIADLCLKRVEWISEGYIGSIQPSQMVVFHIFDEHRKWSKLVREKKYIEFLSTDFNTEFSGGSF